MTKSLDVREYDEIDIPADFLTAQGEISAFPAVLQKDYFSVRYRKGKPVFQAGGYVGTIPVNANFALHISPKVPIANLERIIFLANHAPTILSGFKRRYSPHQFSSKNLSELISDFFLLATEEICTTGLLKLYSPRRVTGFTPKGRINIHDTIRQRASSHDLRVSSTWHSRDIDVPQNQLLKYVLLKMLRDESLTKNRKRKCGILEQLNHLETVSQVECIDGLLSNEMILHYQEHIPSTKDSYLDAISLAKIIVQGKGIAFQGEGEVGGSSLILNLEAAFEGYVLAVLRSSRLPSDGFRVLDGNKAGDFGCKKALFSTSAHHQFINKSVTATPDILIKRNDPESESLVIDVKYKSVKDIADRADLNQIIAYAFSYGSKGGMLVLPANEVCAPGLRNVGVIAGIEFYMYFIDLGVSRMEEVEREFADTIAELMRSQG